MIANADITPALGDDTAPDLFAFADEKSAQNEQAELESGARGKIFRQRRDIVSGQVMEEAQLLRIAIAPDGTLVPDISAKLPGRGIWIACTREAIEAALSKGMFARSAKTKVSAPDNFADLCAQRLSQSVIGMLGMALRSGQLEMGYDKVRAMIAAEPPAWRICAREAARDGRNKIRMASKAAWNATPLLACFNAEQLGGALGRDDVTHAAMREGPLADRFEREALRLAGFRSLIPNDWDTEIADMTLWMQATAVNGSENPD